MAPVVVTLEQALSMSYATLRFVHLGWRVIRVEPTPVPGRASVGDPNRSVGRPVAGDDRHSYFVAPNAGKEAIAINLKTASGQAVLKRLLNELPADVFCTNTMPARHDKLGIDPATLHAVRPELVWCCISAMGLAAPRVPGYDPVIQALCGYMDLTGDPDGPPMQCGPPIIDLKAGDEAFAQVILSLWQRDETGQGATIDISMARAAVSWLHTFLPMLDMGSPPAELRRSGNQHRQFIPVNAYRTADGWIYVAIGSDAQWERFVGQAMFGALDQARFSSNESRRDNKVDLHAGIEAVTRQHPTVAVTAALAAAVVPHAPITPVEGVGALPFVAEHALRTTAPDGRVVRLPPAAVDTEHLDDTGQTLPFAPGYGEHTDALLAEVGFEPAQVEQLRHEGVVA
jgi:crotonobetainyl-CoA:carnitine CoA-transferase CaiB-like acyl-CoA transferase